MSNVKLGLLFLLKALTLTGYTVLVLYIAVNQAWITTTLLIFLPLFGYYFDKFYEIYQMRKKIEEGSDMLSELMKRIDENKKKMEEKDDDKNE